MNAIRTPPQFAGAWAPTGAAVAPSSAAAETSATFSRTFDIYIQPLLERRPARELERPEAFARLPVAIDPVVFSNRPERLLPSNTPAGRPARFRRVELGAASVDVADV